VCSAGAMSIVGSVMGGLGQIGGNYAQMGAAQGAAAQTEYDAGVDENNAKLARDKGRAAAETGEAAKTNVDIETQQALGTGRVGFAGGNVMLDTGSALDWEVNTVQAGALKKSGINDATAQAQWQSSLDSKSLLASAFNKREAARNIRDASKMNFWSGVVGTAGSMLGGMSGSMGGK
jgi:hypothetical protein